MDWIGSLFVVKDFFRKPEESDCLSPGSDQPLAGLNFTWQYKAGSTVDAFMADVPFSRKLSTSLVVPHVALDYMWDTTIFAANPNASAAEVCLTYTNKTGTASPSYVITIPAQGSREIPIGAIVNSTTVDGGSVVLMSTQGLTAFALYNNRKADNYSYAGINAVDMSE